MSVDHFRRGPLKGDQIYFRSDRLNRRGPVVALIDSDPAKPGPTRIAIPRRSRRRSKRPEIEATDWVNMDDLGLSYYGQKNGVTTWITRE